MAQTPTIYLAVWERTAEEDKHISAHTTSEGAAKQCEKWARHSLKEWVDPDNDWDSHYKIMSNSDLVANWGEITENSEFFSTKAMLLNKDCPNPGCHCGACENNK
jgi:hypothetical protein